MTEILDRVRGIKQDPGEVASAWEILLCATALPMASRSDLEGRVLAILDPQRNHCSLTRRTCYALTLVATLLFIPCAILRLGYAQEKKGQEQASSSKNAPAAAKGTSESKPAKAGTTSPEPAEPPPALLTAFGTVLDPAGKPVAGAKVYLREWSTYRISMEPYDRNPNDVLASAQTDGQGAFRFENVPAKPLHEEWLQAIPWDVVVAAKPYAIAWHHLDAAKQSNPLTINLALGAQVTGRVTDRQGRPVRNAEVKVNSVNSLASEWYPAFADPETLDLQESRLAPAAKTDSEGKVTIDGLPRNVRLSVGVTHDDFDRDFVFVATTNQAQPDMEVPTFVDDKQKTQAKKVYSEAFSAALGPLSPRLVGRVVTADTKKPVANLRITAFWKSHSLDALTDEDGRFALKGAALPKYRLYVSAPEGGQYLGRLLLVDVPKEKKEVRIDVELDRGETLAGIVADEESGKGVAGVSVGFEWGFDVNTTTVGGPIATYGKTDREGRFRLAVPPGKGTVQISGPVRGYDLPRPSGQPQEIDEFAQVVEVIPGKSAAEMKFTVRRLAETEEKPLVRRIDPGLPRRISRTRRTVEGKVVDPDGKPVAGAEVGPSLSFRGMDADLPVQTDKAGRFSFRVPSRGLLPDEKIVAIHKGRKLRGHVPLPDLPQGETTNSSLEIRLTQTGVVRGRVMEGEKPISGAEIQLDVFMPVEGRSNRALASNDRDWAKTDENGRFEFLLVEAGKKFNLSVITEGHTDGLRQGQVAAGETLEIEPVSLTRLNKSVAGTVVDPDDKPVAGVTVSAAMRSGGSIPRAFMQRPTGNDGRFTIRGVPNLPLTLMAYIRPPDDSKDRRIHFSARVDAEPGETDVRIVLDPKLVRRKQAEAKPAAVPTPAQVLEKLQARRDSIENFLVEASWEEYNNNKPSSWEEGTIHRDKQGRIRARYYYGPGPLASADKTSAKMSDETYNGKFTVNTSEDPTLDRSGQPPKPGRPAEAANRYRSTLIYNGKWPQDRAVAEIHRNPLRCMYEPVIDELSKLLAAGKKVSVEPVKGRAGVYELGYEFDPKDDPDHLKHRVLVDAGKGWVVLRNEEFFPDGKSARLSTCEYRRGEDGWWLPTTGQFRYLWGKEVPGLDWRFNTKRVVINDPHFDEQVFQPELKGFPLRELTESIAGIIVDPDGKPVEGVSVRVDVHSGPELLMAFPWQLTGKDGRFKIDGLPKAPIPITAYIEPPPDSKKDHTEFPAEVTAQPGQKDLRIVLDPKLVRGKKTK